MLLLFVPLLLWGQSAREQEVAARFEAGTGPDLAWAAALAARYGLSEYVSRIEGLLAHADPAVRAQALDALIRLKVGNTPIETLAPLTETNFEAVMVLLARQPTNARPLLLEWSRRKLDKHRWMVIHSLLASTKAPGQAAVLLRDWTYRAEVRAFDGPAIVPPEPALCVDFAMASKPIYPDNQPVRIGIAYRPAPGTEFVSGPHPLWILGACSVSEFFDPSSFTLDYLRHLGNTISAPKLEIQFRTAAEFERDLARLRREMRDFMQVLHGSLVSSGALAESEWVEPKIEWSLVDRRRDQSVPLPPLR